MNLSDGSPPYSLQTRSGIGSSLHDDGDDVMMPRFIPTAYRVHFRIG